MGLSGEGYGSLEIGVVDEAVDQNREEKGAGPLMEQSQEEAHGDGK